VPKTKCDLDSALTTAEAAAWASVIATFVAVLVALFKEELVRWWRFATLTATFQTKGAGCQKTPIDLRDPSTGAVTTADSYYLRLWIENTGNLRANNVQVFTAKLTRRQADNSFKDVAGFLPMNMRWTHRILPSGQPEVFAAGLSPTMGRFCDLGRIIDPANKHAFGDTLEDVKDDLTVLALALEVEPYTKSHLIGPGVYRLYVRLAAANCEPVPKVFEINLPGQWYADEECMRSKGIGIRDVT